MPKKAKIKAKSRPKLTFVTYMLQCSDETFYIGSTTDITRRLHAHNNWKSGAKYTKIRRPVRLVYQENFATFSEALKREAVLKKLTRKEKLSLLD